MKCPKCGNIEEFYETYFEVVRTHRTLINGEEWDWKTDESLQPPVKMGIFCSECDTPIWLNPQKFEYKEE